MPLKLEIFQNTIMALGEARIWSHGEVFTAPPAPPPARYPPRVAGLRPLPLPAHASISSLHFGCISGNPYLCSFAVSSLHWALGYHGGDLVLTSHLLQHLCLLIVILERKAPIGSVLVRCSPLAQSAVPRDTAAPERPSGDLRYV